MILEKNFDEFIQKYSNKNEKAKYFSISRDGKIKELKPSYILEAAYFYFKGYIKAEKLLDFSQICTLKEKKVKRHSSCELLDIEERFFRSIFNRDSIHSLSLGFELIKRDFEKFLKILYLNAKLSNDPNRLIKIYLFEIIYKDKGLILPLFINLIRYITQSKEGYMDNRKVDELYSKIYIQKFNEDIKINSEMDEDNKILYEILRGEKLC